MSKLDDMINRLCPEGVEFVKLGKVCKNICSGGTPATSKADYYDGDIPWLRTQEVDYCEIHATLRNITKKGLDNSSAKMIPVNCVIVAMYGATAAKVAINKIPLCTNQACCNLHIDNKKANYKFVYYWLCKQYEILKGLGEGTQHNINAMKVKKFEIPLPPLEVQNEIVRILDHFTQLEAELEAELDCRKRQYEYYRDQLLNFDQFTPPERNNRVVWKKLGEVAFYPKTRIDSSKLLENSYIGVENLRKDKLGRTNSTVIPVGSVIQFIKNDILIGNIRPYLRKIWKSDCEGGTNGDVLCIRIKDDAKISADFLFHILSSETFFLYDIRNSKGAKMPRGDKAAVMNFEIPIPPIEEQERIVAILDRFEALTTSLQEGLPAEIAARRQQYEYYRERLLDFKKKTA